MSDRDTNRIEGQRRVDEACHLIASAIRLGRVRGDEVMRSVQSAISSGAEQLAEDIKDEARGVA